MTRVVRLSFAPLVPFKEALSTTAPARGVAEKRGMNEGTVGTNRSICQYSTNLIAVESQQEVTNEIR